jgi:hypothetical protein
LERGATFHSGKVGATETARDQSGVFGSRPGEEARIFRRRVDDGDREGSSYKIDFSNELLKLLNAIAQSIVGFEHRRPAPAVLRLPRRGPVG